MSKYVVKIHHKGLMVLPAELRKKYGIKEGSEAILIDKHTHIILVPRSRITDLYGFAREHGKVIDEMVREIHEERRVEARS
ncbi:MAG: AbrB family transcriptional regulator [Desulfurococcales archaeon ex4484_217_2]|nr:MAG: AbrB family transcriptional regulator [Desulfurococcales archaeon ex4484_217_2]